ncbi:PLCG1 [Mytilus edulis]|uniref:PLCG1 n=1 Tax=Mytilus edulis TaxID=6550 RepID=A0A8S3THV0_MYTED|nr:PLCG1 [Mytilus edulis]
MTRVEADTLLQKYKHMGDGAFLVRESKILTGNYILSILIKDETVHLRIHTKEDSGQLKYDFNGNLFDSLDNYIEFLKHDSSDQSSYNPCILMIIKQVDRTETRLNKVHTISNQNHIVAINSIQGIIKKDKEHVSITGCSLWVIAIYSCIKRNNAKNECQQKGGYLVKVESVAENAWLISALHGIFYRKH